MAKKAFVLKKPGQPDAASLKRAHAILCYAHDSATALLTVFDETRTRRRSSGGATSDEEQDLLRSMLVFACAGLDSLAKHVVRENLSLVARKDKQSRDALEKTLARRLMRTEATSDDPTESFDAKFLARVLVGRRPLDGVLDALADELTAGSLQSAEEILRVATHLGLQPPDLVDKVPRLKKIFKERNRIIHEMDVDFEHVSRNRRTHKRDEIVASVNEVLGLGDILLKRVNELLARPEGG